MEKLINFHSENLHEKKNVNLLCGKTIKSPKKNSKFNIANFINSTLEKCI